MNIRTRLASRWQDAATALRRGDDDALIDILAPRDHQRACCYTETVALAIVGVSLTAAAVADAYGTAPNPGAFRPAERDPAVERSATERLGDSLVLDALNRDYDSILDKLAAYAAPDDAGIARIADLVVGLLRAYNRTRPVAA